MPDDDLTGDLAQLADQQERVRQVAGSYDGFAEQPGLAASLALSGATGSDIDAVGGFVKGLQLSKRVALARQSGIRLNLTDEDRGLLAVVGTHYDDVDFKSFEGMQWKGGQGGFLGRVSDMVNRTTQLPVIKQTFAAMDRAYDVGNSLYRMGEQSPLTLQGLANYALGDPAADRAEDKATMASQGYDRDILGTLSFYSRGKQQFHGLDDLRKEYDPETVDLAKLYLIDPEAFTSNRHSTEELIKRDKLMRDQGFQTLVTEVDARHLSPGRDIANALQLDPDTKIRVGPGLISSALGTLTGDKRMSVDAFTAVSGSIDAVYSFAADPTLIAGKARGAYKVARYGIGQLNDAVRIEGLMTGNRAIKRGWSTMLEDAKIMRSGDKAEAAAAYARVRGRTPELVPILDEINGGGLRQGKVIDSYDDLVEHISGHVGLLRMRNGLAIRNAPLMPGAVATVGYRRIRGALAAAATNRGVRIIDLEGKDARMVVGIADGVTPDGKDATGLDNTIGLLANAEGVGEQAAAWRRTRNGRASMFANRIFTLLPERRILDLKAGQGAEDIRRFAAMYMPKAHANALAAKYAVGSLADRRAIAEAAYEQVIHAAGVPSSTSGNAWWEAEKARKARYENAAYDATGQDRDAIIGTNGEVTRREALYLGQTNDKFVLPDPVELRRFAAKVSIYDHVLKSSLESSVLDKVMHTIRTGWLTNPAGAERNAIESYLSAKAFGIGGAELARSRAGLSSVTAQRTADRLAALGAREVDDKFRAMRGTVRGTFVGRILSGMRRVEGAVGATVGGEEAVARAEDIYEMLQAGQLRELEAMAGIGTLAAHETVDDAVEMMDKGFAVSRAAFKRTGYALDDLDGLGGVRHWANELGRRFSGSDGAYVLRAAVDGTDAAVPAKVAVSDIRAWAKAHSYSVPKDESRIGMKARKAYHAANPMPSGREALITHMLSKEYEQARATMERFSVLRDGTPVGDDEALLRRAAEELADDQIEDMKALITGRNGEVHTDLVAKLVPHVGAGGSVKAGGIPTVGWLDSYVDEAKPAKVIQPAYVPNLDGGLGQAANLAQSLVDPAYKYAVAKPLNWLATLPILHANYTRSYRHVSEALAGLDPVAPGAVEKAEAQLAKAKLADEAKSSKKTTAAVKEAEREHSEAKNATENWKNHIRETALQHAMDATVQMIDNPRVRSQMSLITRNLFNFWRAQEDFARRWARNMKEDPALLRKAQLVVEGGMHTGLVYRDEQGELVFAYPGSGYAIQAIGKSLDVVGLGHYVGLGTMPNLTTKLEFLNSGLDRPFLPTTSPVAGLPVRALKMATGDPVWAIQLQQITEGNLGASRGWWSQALPSVVYRVQAAKSTDDREGQFASATRNAALNLYAADLTPQPHVDPVTGQTIAPQPDEQDRFKQRLRIGVRNHLVSRAILATVLPGAPSNPSEETAASLAGPLEAEAFNTTNLQGAFRTMVGRYGYAKALAVWTASHPDDLIYTVSTTEGPGGVGGYIGPTDEVLGWIKDNPELVDKYPSLAAYFAPDGPGDFSQDAWRVELELGLRQHKNLDTFYRDVVVKNAETTYYKMRDKRDRLTADAQQSGGDEKAISTSFNSWATDFKNANPFLLEKWQMGDVNKIRIAQLVTEAEALSTSPLSRSLDPNGDLVRLVKSYRNKTQWDASHKGRTDGAIAERDSADVSYKEYVAQILTRSPYLLPLYKGIFDKVD